MIRGNLCFPLKRPRRRVRFKNGPHPLPHVIVDDATGIYLGGFATENARERHCIRATPPMWPIEEEPQDA